jgi:hypothetical protein
VKTVTSFAQSTVKLAKVVGANKAKRAAKINQVKT